MNHESKVVYGHEENETLKVSHGLHSKISLEEENIVFVCFKNKGMYSLGCPVASARSTTQELSLSATEEEH